MKLVARSVTLIILLLAIVVIISVLFQSHPSQLSLKINSDLLLERITRLNAEAESLFVRWEYDSSLSNYNLALKLANYSPADLDSIIARLYSKMGSCHIAKYDYDRADSCWSSAIAVRETITLCSQSELAEDLKKLGEVCTFIGQMDRAKTSLEHALAIEKNLYGEDNRKTVDCINKLAWLTKKSGNLQEAKVIKRKGLKILEESLGVDSLDERILKKPARQHNLLHEVSDEERYLRDRLRLTMQKHGMISEETVEMLRELGSCLFRLHEREKVISTFRQAYDLAVKVYGPRHPTTARILWETGYDHRVLSNYLEAESLQTQALAIFDILPGYHDEEIASVLVELGAIHTNLTHYETARAYLKQAEGLLEAQNKYPSSLQARILNLCGNMALDLGRLSEAESLYIESMKMRTFLEGPRGPSNAEPCNNLGNVSLLLNRYEEAKKYFAEALRLREEEFDSNYAYLDYSLIGLGNVQNAIGEFSEAIPFFERAARICRLSYQPDHEHFAWIAEGLGDSYRGMRLYRKADSCYQKALQILTKLFGDSHPSRTPLLHKQALLHGSMGDFPKAHAAYSQLLQTRRNYLFEVFAYLPEEQRIPFLHENPMIAYSLLSLALLHNTPQTSDLAMEMVLKGKSAALDAAMTEKRNIHCSPREDIRQAMKSRFQVCSNISGLTLASWKTGLPDLFRDSLRMLRQKKDSLDIELGTCSNFADDIISRKVTVRQVAEALPGDSKLVEYVWYVPYNFSVVGPDSIKEGNPRYLAMILNSRGKTCIRDLGSAKTIDSLVREVRKALYDQGTLRQHYLPEESKEQLASASRLLYDLIWTPLMEDLRSCSRVLIAPDGELNLLPFEILPDADNKYVIENYRISYLSSGRDLLAPERTFENTGLALLISNPNFELSGKKPLSVDSGQIRNSSLGVSNHSGQTRGLMRGLTQRFNPLPQTQSEVIAIKQVLEAEMKSDIVLLTGDSATEENLYNYAKSPRILHVATHAFYLETDTSHVEEDMGNSLIGSGLALTGANQLVSGGRIVADSPDGVLTAFEVSGIDLNGTEIAFLSACETGVGTVRNGEGIFGFRRAFQIAGAKSLVMSLWKVPDKDTRELVAYFYSNWLGGLTKSEALRKSALSLLESHREKDGTSDPFYWGAFVLSGDPN
jgi:CHAT domain-containing protein/tetratricopeptide (TPR) repeat protein